MRRGVVLRKGWKMASTYWFSNERGSAWLLLLSAIGLNMVLVYITVELNLWQGNFYLVIQNVNQGGFSDAIVRYGLWVLLLIVVKGYQIYFRMLLHIHWRRWLTDRYLSQWLQNKTYYQLQLTSSNFADNPDQRISEDVDLFVSITLRLTLDLFNDMITICSFLVILWNLSSVVSLSFGTFNFTIYGYLVWTALAYAIIGTYCTFRLGRPLVRLDYDQQRYEADFRFSLMRIRENAESIALYDGEYQEKENCLQRFKYIFDNFTKIIAIRKQLMWLTTGYSHISVIFAIAMASPRYFRGQIHLGQMFQIIDAYNHVQTGFSFIIDSFTRLAQWRAVINRLNSFLLYIDTAQMEKMAQERQMYNKHKGKFSIRDVSISQPDGHNLVSGLNFHITSGERMIITGPSGCGKSTLLRTFAGLWPFATGRIDIPYEGRIMFVPQKPYMPIDKLRKILLYSGSNRQFEDRELIDALKDCRLAHFADKLDEICDWGQILSLGEQQRIAFARILLLKPEWLFLDEATSALDEATEKTVYERISEFLPHTSIVSVGHRKTIFHYHKNCLVLDGRGGWCIRMLE
ncbi:putative ATP-binding cassette transporter [Sporomusaceae bacterium BoRhaA]|uniref:ABC transporter ATP-binding protein/permease n=1 Tax=Pelorhabdus rhamnosifermentans TaxID=2772457 RepID=UPI001C0620AC|nr:ABC transporter ATP-binding protein/permease [Pelorhabdus rhamnosifermentans]MBU2701814.1 putative ATP-binding cassette transporter [Pelorhabdus rhamnosifermentans]